MKSQWLCYGGSLLWTITASIGTISLAIAASPITVLAANPDDLEVEAIALTPADLPPGFTDLPPSISAQIVSQFSALREQFGQADIPIRDRFAFFNPAQMQAVVGFTGELNTPEDQAEFDRNLAQLQNPDQQKQILAQIESRLSQIAAVEIEGYQELPNLESLADTATGFTLNLTIEGVPFQVDLISFRRDRMGAFTATLSRQSDSDLPILDIATTLDQKIVAALGLAPSPSPDFPAPSE